jgi:hypothetical protein
MRIGVFMALLAFHQQLQLTRIVTVMRIAIARVNTGGRGARLREAAAGGA